jgi:hypothetical protein
VLFALLSAVSDADNKHSSCTVWLAHAASCNMTCYAAAVPLLLLLLLLLYTHYHAAGVC